MGYIIGKRYIIRNEMSYINEEIIFPVSCWNTDNIGISFELNAQNSVIYVDNIILTGNNEYRSSMEIVNQNIKCIDNIKGNFISECNNNECCSFACLHNSTCIMSNYVYNSINQIDECYHYRMLCEFIPNYYDINTNIITIKTSINKCIPYNVNWRDSVDDDCESYTTDNLCDNGQAFTGLRGFQAFTSPIFDSTTALDACCNCDGGYNIINGVKLIYYSNIIDNVPLFCEFNRDNNDINTIINQKWDINGIYYLCNQLKQKIMRKNIIYNENNPINITLNCDFVFYNSMEYNINMCQNDRINNEYYIMTFYVHNNITNVYINQEWFDIPTFEYQFYNSTCNSTEIQQQIDDQIYSIYPCDIITISPTLHPTNEPTISPSKNTIIPSISPTNLPTNNPTTSTPTNNPSGQPTKTPSILPTLIPTFNPTIIPSKSPTVSPTIFTSINPTNNPSISPTIIVPTNTPSNTPTYTPTNTPSFGSSFVNISEYKSGFILKIIAASFLIISLILGIIGVCYRIKYIKLRNKYQSQKYEHKIVRRQLVESESKLRRSQRKSFQTNNTNNNIIYTNNTNTGPGSEHQSLIHQSLCNNNTMIITDNGEEPHQLKHNKSRGSQTLPATVQNAIKQDINNLNNNQMFSLSNIKSITPSNSQQITPISTKSQLSHSTDIVHGILNINTNIVNETSLVNGQRIQITTAQHNNINSTYNIDESNSKSKITILRL